MAKCTICGKTVKGMAAHLRRNHKNDIPSAGPDESHTDNDNLDQAIEEITEERTREGDILEIDSPTLAAEGNQRDLFHCVDCGTRNISRGTLQCPACGVGLDWGAFNA